jgi:DNA-binding NarL/FixJ family response regulator
MIRVFLIDNQKLFTDAIANEFKYRVPEMELVGTARGCTEALNLLKKLSVDVVLLDLNLPEISGMDCYHQLRKQFSQIKLIVLTGLFDTSILYKAWVNGVDGIQSKNSGLNDLINIIEEVMLGKRIIGKDFTDFFNGVSIQTEFSNAQLTPSEAKVLGLLAEGCSNKNAAVTLHVSIETVKFHCKNILKKFNSHKMSLVISAARKQHLIP